tara:strand:- start:2277 stop:3368 length:1092 start_codon:yes stop_codon:yes gene_type:complete
MPQRCWIRTDASVIMGAGHVARCLTLANALRCNGFDVDFICRAHEGNLNNLISSNGFLVHQLPRLLSTSNVETPRHHGINYPDWLGVSQEKDADETIAALGGTRTDWIIVDHYGLDHQWETKMREHTLRILVIDDLANRFHDCDILLDQNLYSDQYERYRNLTISPCEKLLGPEYALLHPSFRAMRKQHISRTGPAKRILVSFGGADITNATALVLEALSDPPLSGLALDVVIGITNPHRNHLENIVNSRKNATLHIQTQNMATLMSHADLSIGAGGTTIWERLCLNLFTFTIATAPNQILPLEELRKRNLINHLGSLATVDPVIIKRELDIFLHQSSHQQTEFNTNLVDGLGVHRTLATILQ